MLPGQRLLLVLDNFEHVVAASIAIAELLAAVPGPMILVTSRVALRVQGEQALPLPPLTVPDQKQLVLDGADLAAIPKRYPAIRLFLDRAWAVRPEFGLTRDNVESIAEVCRRLDGLPLAIELAAARSSVLSPAAMLTRLEQRLPLLTGGAADLPARHQTLSAAIAWSYNLLDRAEQTLLRRLGVFVGGWDVPAAASVCLAEEGDSDDSASEPRLSGDEPADTLGRLESLVRKSLIRTDDRTGLGDASEPRFGMLETLRDYARERLAEANEMEAMRRRHATYFLAVAEERGPRAYGTDAEVWLDRLERDHDNFRAALRWAAENGEGETSLRLSAALYIFWYLRGHVSEGKRWLGGALASEVGRRPEDAPGPRKARAWALHAAGLLANDSGEDIRIARGLTEESLAILRTLDDRRRLANSLHNLARFAGHQGDYAAARALLEESLGLWRELGDRWGLAAVLRGMAQLAIIEGDHERARRDIAECLRIARSTGDTLHVATGLDMKGWLEQLEGQLDLARAHLIEGLALLSSMGARKSFNYASLLALLARIHLAAGDDGAAASALQESLASSREHGFRGWVVAIIVETAAMLAVARGYPTRAFRLAGAAQTMRQTAGTPPYPPERKELEASLTQTRRVLSEAEAALALATGGELTVEQAIAEGIEVTRI
jgi:predicted ATPase